MHGEKLRELILVLLLTIILFNGCVDTERTASYTFNSGEGMQIPLNEFYLGGTDPFYCTLSEGQTLPEGITLEGCLLLTKIYLPQGTSTRILPPMSFDITDSSQPPSTITVKLTITIVMSQPKISANPSVACVAKELCNIKLAYGEGGSIPYYFSQGSLAKPSPLGTIITQEGYLYGTPTKEGNYTIEVCLADASANTVCTDVAVQVYPEGTILEWIPSDDTQVTNGEGPFTLNVKKQGNGSGTIKSEEEEINCGNKCLLTSPNNYDLITLNAIPDEGSFFGYWIADKDACDYANKDLYTSYSNCSITLDRDRIVTGQFFKNPKVKITSAKCTFLKSNYGGSEVVYSITASGTAYSDANGGYLSIGTSQKRVEGEINLSCNEWSPTANEECTRVNDENESTNWSYSDSTIAWTTSFKGDGKVTIYAMIGKLPKDSPAFMIDKWITEEYTVYCD